MRAVSNMNPCNHNIGVVCVARSRGVLLGCRGPNSCDGDVVAAVLHHSQGRTASTSCLPCQLLRSAIWMLDSKLSLSTTFTTINPVPDQGGSCWTHSARERESSTFLPIRLRSWFLEATHSPLLEYKHHLLPIARAYLSPISRSLSLSLNLPLVSFLTTSISP